MKRSNPLRLHFMLFIILSIVAIAQLSWWVIFQVQEGGRIKSLQREIWKQQIKTATVYFEMADLTVDERPHWLNANFPDLLLNEDGSGLIISARAGERLDDLAQKRVRMFVSEGAFFSLLVLTGIWFFYWALRKRIELENKTAAILGAAHTGMKDPLSIIERDITSLLESEKADPDQKNLLSNVSSNLRKISDICENVSLVRMLTLSKRKMDLVVTDISEATNSLIAGYKTSILRSNLRIENKIEDRLTAVTDPVQWSKIVLGFLRVAESHSVENGSIFLNLDKSGDLAVLKALVSPDSAGVISTGILENIESELSIIRELAETIGVRIKVIPEGDNKLSLRAEIPLLEE